MLAIIQEIGVIQSVIIAACFGFMLGMLVVILGDRINKQCNSDYVDWSKIDLRALWVSADKDGRVNGFASRPEIAHSKDEEEWYWRPKILDGHYWNEVDKSSVIGPLPPWRESLRRRPS